MRVAIGEEVIKGLANEIGFISSGGDRGRSGIRGSGGEIKFVGGDKARRRGGGGRGSWASDFSQRPRFIFAVECRP